MSDATIYLLWDGLQFLINGLTQGSIYALVALGYTMVYGIIRLVNFAHGEFLMLGSMGAFYAYRFGLPLPIVLLTAIAVAAFFALLTEKCVYRPVRNENRITSLMTAIGASLFFQYSGQVLFGASPKKLPDLIEEKYFNFYDVSISSSQLLIIGMTLVVMLLLYLLVHFTKIGKAMRAVSFNPKAAELSGINTQFVISFTFFIGAALAGLSGVLLSNIMTVEPLMGTMLGLKAFIAAVLGGIGHIPGAFLGGLILGIFENLVAGFYKASFRDIVSFVILIVLLMIRPQGILGKNQREKI